MLHLKVTYFSGLCRKSRATYLKWPLGGLSNLLIFISAYDSHTPASVVVVIVRRRRPQFQRSSLKPLANESQTSCGASLARGNESLYKWSRSHDQDGRQGYK